jgi:hypothetical protein
MNYKSGDILRGIFFYLKTNKNNAGIISVFLNNGSFGPSVVRIRVNKKVDFPTLYACMAEGESLL